jgi:crotonobetainyl-CoA:carnitine CoA-transferase CaiB-like acyl-CoA transferase
MDPVLKGIRVLDISRFVSGPGASMLLADFGAEVIRVERSGGEEDRYVGLQTDFGDSFTFMNSSRNKKGITLNYLSNKRACAILLDLIKKSDVLLHNFSPGVVKQIGISYDEIASINPEIIYVEVTGFGSEGPYAERLGFDMIGQAMSGAMALTGFQDTPPFKSITFVDYGTAFLGALGIMLALYHRRVTGRGQKIECNLFQTAIFMNCTPISEYEATGTKRVRMANRCHYCGPADLYKTKDGKWFYIAPITKGLFKRWCKLMDRMDLYDRRDLATESDRYNHREEIDPINEEWIKTKTADEAKAACEQARLPYSLVYDTDEVVNDPQARLNEAMMNVDFGNHGVFKLCGFPIKLSNTPAKLKSPPPRVGEHNEDVFGRILGYSQEELRKLRDEGVL